MLENCMIILKWWTQEIVHDLLTRWPDHFILHTLQRNSHHPYTPLFSPLTDTPAIDNGDLLTPRFVRPTITLTVQLSFDDCREIILHIWKRLGHCKNFLLMEVVSYLQETQSILFGDESPHQFKKISTHSLYATLLHEVLACRTVIPATLLAIIYTAVVRRVWGVDLDLFVINEAFNNGDTPWRVVEPSKPGHVVVGLPFDEGTPLAERVFVDVFRGGRRNSFQAFGDPRWSY